MNEWWDWAYNKQHHAAVSNNHAAEFQPLWANIHNVLTWLTKQQLYTLDFRLFNKKNYGWWQPPASCQETWAQKRVSCAEVEGCEVQILPACHGPSPRIETNKAQLALAIMMNLFSIYLGDVRSIFINLFYPTQLIQPEFLTVPAGFLHAWARSFFRTSSCCAGFKPLICPWSLGEKGLIAPCYLWNYTSIKHVEPWNFHGQTWDNSHWNSTYSKFCLSRLPVSSTQPEPWGADKRACHYPWFFVKGCNLQENSRAYGLLSSACVGWKYQKSWSSRLRLEQLTTFIHASLSKDVFLMKIYFNLSFIDSLTHTLGFSSDSPTTSMPLL